MTAAAHPRPVADSVWRGQDVRPGEIEEALRGMVTARHAENAGYVPARALNMVCVVDREWSGEIANRLARVGREGASRTVVAAVEPGRTTIDAVATVVCEIDPRPGEFSLMRETLILYLGPEHLHDLYTIVDPLVVTDIPTLVWSPHGHPEAVDALLGLAQVVLLDSVDEPDVRPALLRVCQLAERVHVVDLAWLRSTPWRERVAAAFDPPVRRPELGTITKVSVRHRHDSAVSALLLVGWLCSRLGWHPEALTAHEGVLRGHARGRRGEVEVRLEPVPMSVPGLAGIELTSAGGEMVALERGTGGLTARRRQADGHERTWTVLGASRGEPGILGEGMRQALLRDPTYVPALQATQGLLG